MGQIQTVEKKPDIKCLLLSDVEYCGIFGCVVLPSGNVIATDFYNHKVKIVNTDSGHVINAFTLTSGPSDVTVVRSTKVAVTLTDERKLQLLHVTDRDSNISLDYRLKVDGACMGIDHDATNDVFVVSFINPSQIQLIHIDGVVIRTIKTGGYRPYSVYFSRDKTHFYCCDSGNSEVIKLRRDNGRAVAINRDIRQPTGVIELPDNNILVVGSDTNAVHLLPPDCSIQSVVMSARDDIGSPRAVCLLQRGGRVFDLIVSNKNGSILSVYRVTFHSGLGRFDISRYL